MTPKWEKSRGPLDAVEVGRKEERGKRVGYAEMQSADSGEGGAGRPGEGAHQNIDHPKPT